MINNNLLFSYLFSLIVTGLTFYISYKCMHGVEGTCSLCEEAYRLAQIGQCHHPNWTVLYNDGTLTNVVCDFGQKSANHVIKATQAIAYTCPKCHAVACINCYTG